MEINTLNGDLRSTAVQLTAAAYKWTPSSFYKRSRLLRHFDNQVKGQEAHPNQLPSQSQAHGNTGREKERGGEIAIRASHEASGEGLCLVTF